MAGGKQILPLRIENFRNQENNPKKAILSLRPLRFSLSGTNR